MKLLNCLLEKYVPFLHAIYLFIAAIAGFFGVFLIGVPAVGDNPGAVAGGIFPFIGVYLFLLVGESLVYCLVIRKKSMIRAGLELFAAVISSFLAACALTLAHYSLYFWGERFTSPMALVTVSVLLFLLFEWLVRMATNGILRRILIE